MSEPTEKEDSSKPFSALSFENPDDPGILSLSDSDPALSDDAEVESVSAEDNDDDDNDNEDCRQEAKHESQLQPFILKGTDTGFSQRSHGIFGGLLGVRKSSPLIQSTKEKPGATASLAAQVSADGSEQKGKTLCGSFTTTKRPAPATNLPDYVAHPERWTKYSLEDAPDTSDRANRNTALSLMAELKNRKEAKEVSKDATNPRSFNQDSSSSGEGRILFTKPPKKNQKNDEKGEAQLGQQNKAGPWGDDGLEEPEVSGELEKSESLGFHGVRKRSRKNIRAKADANEEDKDSS